MPFAVVKLRDLRRDGRRQEGGEGEKTGDDGVKFCLGVVLEEA